MRRRSFLQVGAGSLGGAFMSGYATGSGLESPGSAAEPFEPLGFVEIEGTRDAAVHHGGDVAYVAASDGFVAVDITDPAHPTILAEVREVETHTDDYLIDIRDLWPSGDRLAVVGPGGLIDDAPNGIGLFDISDPAAPEQVAFHPTDDTFLHNSFFADDIVYLTGSELHEKPLIMVDVSNDDPEELNRWSILDEDPAWDEVTSHTRQLHDIYVQDDVAYLAMWNAGTWILDVSDPTDPTVISVIEAYTAEELAAMPPAEVAIRTHIPPGNHHYVQVDEDANLLAIGVEAWTYEDTQGTIGEPGELIGGPGSVYLWDISEPGEPELLAEITAPESYDQTNAGTFTTAHNLDIREGRLYTSWYYGGVKIHDITDPSNPEELAWWRDPDQGSFWTAQVARSGETFVASSINLGAMWTGMRESWPGLFVFPDRTGTQPNPPDLTVSPHEDDSDGDESDDDPDDGEDDGSDTGGPDDGEGQTDHDGTDDTRPEAEDDAVDHEEETDRDDADADDDGPAPGIGGAVLALGGAALLKQRSERSSEE